ncbi:hypothetical protein ScPMuIL_009289 [Solemya velum]
MTSDRGENQNLVVTKQFSYVTVNSSPTSQSTTLDIDDCSGRLSSGNNTIHADDRGDEKLTYDQHAIDCLCGMSQGCENLKEKHFCMELETLTLGSPNGKSGNQPHSGESWHCHAREKQTPDRIARNQLIAVSVLCFLFMIGEAIGGMLSNSLALFTDVLHLASDLVSFLLGLLAMYLSRKPRTLRMSFGYHRAEVLGALFSVFIIWLVTGVLLYIAVERIIQKHYKEVKADEMLITASLGVAFNIIMGFVLQSEKCCGSAPLMTNFGHGHGHSHSNGQDKRHPSMNNQDSHAKSDFDYQHLDSDSSDSDTSAPKQNQKNLNVRAAFIHVIGDIIQSLGVFVAAIIIKVRPEEVYRLADPICTFVFSLLVLVTTINILKDTLLVIMEGVPSGLNYTSIRKDLRKVPGVVKVHDLFVWSLTLHKNVLAVHLAVDPTSSHQKVLEKSSLMLNREYSFHQTIIQIEDSADLRACENCIGPLTPS